VEACFIWRRHGISEQTFYRWKARYGGLEGNEERRLRQLDARIPASSAWSRDLTLDTSGMAPPSFRT